METLDTTTLLRQAGTLAVIRFLIQRRTRETDCETDQKIERMIAAALPGHRV